MTFFIDSQQVGNFIQAPDGNTSYTYNALVYANESLTLTPHTISIEAGYGGIKSLIILGYITYTYVKALSPGGLRCADRIA